MISVEWKAFSFFQTYSNGSTLYYYEEFHVTRGSLDPSVDCTYVLIMHGSPRKEQIYRNVVKSNLTTKCRVSVQLWLQKV